LVFGGRQEKGAAWRVTLGISHPPCAASR